MKYKRRVEILHEKETRGLKQKGTLNKFSRWGCKNYIITIMVCEGSLVNLAPFYAETWTCFISMRQFKPHWGGGGQILSWTHMQLIITSGIKVNPY